MKLHNEDLGKLILRIAVGGLMLFHGIHKVINGHDFIAGKLAEAGLPTFLVLGVPVGEVLAPLMLIVGLQVEIAALVVAFTMVMSIYLVFADRLMSLNQVGGWAPELNMLFLLGSVAIVLLGPGKYSLQKMIPSKKRK